MDPPQRGLVDTGEGRLFVRSAGAGPDVVLLHGFGDSSASWAPLARRLRSASFRVTSIDALGAGRSEKPRDGDYGLAAHARRLAAVLDGRGITMPSFVANSYGGSVALVHALAAPAAVHRLVLLSPAAYPEGGWLPSWIASAPRLCAAALAAVPRRWLVRAALHAVFGERDRIRPGHVRRFTSELRRAGVLRAAVEQLRVLRPPRARARAWIDGYAQLRVPTLVVWGCADRILSPRLGERLAAQLPDARLVQLPTAGHALHLECPDRIAAETLRFLQPIARVVRCARRASFTGARTGAPDRTAR